MDTELSETQLASITKLFSNSFPANPAIPAGKFRITKHCPEYKLYNKLLSLIQDANLIPMVFECHTPEPSLILDLTEFVIFDWFDLYSSDNEHAPEKFTLCTDLGYNESVYDIASHETGITSMLLSWTILLFDSTGRDGTKSLDPECNPSGHLTIRKKINLRQEIGDVSSSFDVFIMNLPDRDIKHRQLCFINSYCLAVRIDNEIRRIFF